MTLKIILIYESWVKSNVNCVTSEYILLVYRQKINFLMRKNSKYQNLDFSYLKFDNFCQLMSSECRKNRDYWKLMTQIPM